MQLITWQELKTLMDSRRIKVGNPDRVVFPARKRSHSLARRHTMPGMEVLLTARAMKETKDQKSSLKRVEGRRRWTLFPRSRRLR